MAAAIGGNPDVSVFVRPYAARSDTYWGPLLARVLSQTDTRDEFISHQSGTAVLNAQQIDLHVTVRDPLRYKRHKDDMNAIGWIGILHGQAPIDPLSLRTGGGLALFAPPSRLPSGALMYPPDPAYLREYGDFAPTLFVTAYGASIVTEQVSAPRTRDMLAYNGTPPPPLQAAPDALAGVTFGVTSLRFMDARNSDRASMLQGAVAAGFGLRGGYNGAVDGYADYASADDALRAYGAFQRTCEQKMDTCVFEPGMFKDARAERLDNRIVVTLAFSDALLRSIQRSRP